MKKCNLLKKGHLYTNGEKATAQICRKRRKNFKDELGGKNMNTELNENKEKVKEIICVLNLLESDMEQQKVDELYVRVVRFVCRMIREIEV